MAAAKESEYQGKLIKTLKSRFPGCTVLKNDPNYIQGIPDLTVLVGQCWGVLEVKREKKSRRQVNQDHYIKSLGEQSFAAVIYPENEEEVLSEMERSFASRAEACVPKS